MKLLHNIISFIVMFIWFGILSIFEILVTSAELQAKDFGTQGHSFAIIEEDFLEVINAKLTKINWDEFNKKVQNKTKEYIERPIAVAGITKSKESKEFFYDPTYVLDQEVRDHKNQLIHGAGTKINPLEFAPLREDLIFIDGDDETQINLALKLRKEKQERVKIILVKGSPLKLQREEKIWIYFDQGGILTSKLGITQVPTLVTQEGVQLKIKIFGGDL